MSNTLVPPMYRAYLMGYRRGEAATEVGGRAAVYPLPAEVAEEMTQHCFDVEEEKTMYMAWSDGLYDGAAGVEPFTETQAEIHYD